MKGIWKILPLCILAFLLEACSNSNGKEIEGEGIPESAGVGEVFYEQKELTFGDSLHIRVLSWGGKETGSYLVLVADSVNEHYIGDSFFRQGKLVKTWVDDLDKDGWPEIAVVLEGKGNIPLGRLFLHELSGDFTLQSVQFSPLSETLGADYGGNDTIYRRDDKTIVREFHLLNRLDSLAENSDRRRVEYVLENNQLVVSGSKDIK